MKAVKENREYTVDEKTKGAYLARGFCICDDAGKVIEYPATAMVKREQYEQLLAENERLTAENAQLRAMLPAETKKGK